jgi:regulator of protease activity HflC (stomatin/prohibitin superfamily)
MINAMSRQAQSERERRAKVIHAEGEYEASRRLAEAGAVMREEPATLQLRFLQTLTEIASEKNSTIVFPVPIDILSMFMQGGARASAAESPATRTIPQAEDASS